MREAKAERDAYRKAAKIMRSRVIGLGLHRRSDPAAEGYKKALLDWAVVLRDVMSE